MADATERWQVTVLHGKETFAVEIYPPLISSAWLRELQEEVAVQSGVAVAHQKLLFRGKQLGLAHAADLKNGSKLMLLKNASFHKASAAETAQRALSTSSRGENAESVAAPAVTRAVPDSQRLGLDASEIDDDHVLLQAMRGKAVYEFLFLTTATIGAVKDRVGGALGLPAAAIRLLLKGKSPSNDAVLGGFLGDKPPATRILKCMVLLQAKQHELMEREDEFRLIQNELTSVQQQIQKLARIMTKNVLPKEQIVLELHVLQDHSARLRSNLEIVDEQLHATKLLDSNSATLKALDHVKQECGKLQDTVDALARQFERGQSQN